MYKLFFFFGKAFPVNSTKSGFCIQMKLLNDFRLRWPRTPRFLFCFFTNNIIKYLPQSICFLRKKTPFGWQNKFCTNQQFILTIDLKSTWSHCYEIENFTFSINGKIGFVGFMCFGKKKKDINTTDSMRCANPFRLTSTNNLKYTCKRLKRRRGTHG